MRDKTKDLKSVMVAGSGPDEWPDAQHDVRNTLKQPIRMLFAGTSLGSDAYRIFCDSLADPSFSVPNLAVVRIAHARERSQISNLLQAMESDAMCGPLPVVVLSPTGSLTLDNEILASRSNTMLATPIHAARFMAVIERVIHARPSTQAA